MHAPRVDLPPTDKHVESPFAFIADVHDSKVTKARSERGSEIADEGDSPRPCRRIRPDFTFLAGAYSKIADAIVNFTPGTTPDPAALAKLQKVAAEIDTNRLTQASQNIAAWLQENCHP